MKSSWVKDAKYVAKNYLWFIYWFIIVFSIPGLPLWHRIIIALPLILLVLWFKVA